MEQVPQGIPSISQTPPPTQQSPSPKAPKKDNKKKLLIIFLVCATLILVGYGFALFFLLKGNIEKQKPSTLENSVSTISPTSFITLPPSINNKNGYEQPSTDSPSQPVSTASSTLSSQKDEPTFHITVTQADWKIFNSKGEDMEGKLVALPETGGRTGTSRSTMILPTDDYSFEAQSLPVGENEITIFVDGAFMSFSWKSLLAEANIKFKFTKDLQTIQVLDSVNVGEYNYSASKATKTFGDRPIGLIVDSSNGPVSKIGIDYDMQSIKLYPTEKPIVYYVRLGSEYEDNYISEAITSDITYITTTTPINWKNIKSGVVTMTQ